MSGLSEPFRQWRDRRERELLVMEGKSAEYAHLWADREARSRQDAEALIGKDAALSADLVIEIRNNGTYGIFVKVPIDKIPQHLRCRAAAWASATGRDPIAH